MAESTRLPNRQDQTELIESRLIEGKIVFYHSPGMWQIANDLPVDLVWFDVPFGDGHQSKIPRDQTGVYSFVLRPQIKGAPVGSYILYIGKTEQRRGFRRRYQDYLSDTKRWVRSTLAIKLRQWEGHISFCYAPVSDPAFIDRTEELLLNSCVPSLNDNFRGTIGSAITAFRHRQA